MTENLMEMHPMRVRCVCKCPLFSVMVAPLRLVPEILLSYPIAQRPPCSCVVVSQMSCKSKSTEERFFARFVCA